MKIIKIIFLISVITSFAFAKDQPSNKQAPSEQDQIQVYMKKYWSKPVVSTLLIENSKPDKKAYKVIATETIKGTRNYVLNTMSGTGAEMLYAFNTKGTIIKPVEPKNWKKANDDFSNESYSNAVRLMRPFVYPMFKFLSKDNDIFEINDYADTFLTALIKNGQIMESLAIFEKIDLQNSIDGIVRTSLILTKELAKMGNYKSVDRILSKINIQEEGLINILYMMDILASLCEKDQLKIAGKYYAKISYIKEDQVANLAKLWRVYCEMQIGQREGARLDLESLKVLITKNDRDISLLNFVNGLFVMTSKDFEKLSDEDITKALNSFSQAIVLGQMSDDWMSQLLYSSALCYERYGKKDVAKEIYKQLIVFYPDDKFSKEAQKQLNKK